MQLAAPNRLHESPRAMWGGHSCPPTHEPPRATWGQPPSAVQAEQSSARLSRVLPPTTPHHGLVILSEAKDLCNGQRPTGAPGSRRVFSIVLFHDRRFRGANLGETPDGSKTDPTFAKERQTWGTKIESDSLRASYLLRVLGHLPRALAWEIVGRIPWGCSRRNHRGGRVRTRCTGWISCFWWGYLNCRMAGLAVKD